MTDNSKPTTPSTVEFDYLKSNFFRVVRANGAFGGFSPDGSLYMAIYSERPAMPDASIYAIESTGKVGAEIMAQRKVTSKGIVRELEVGLSFDVAVAKAIIQWLSERVEMAEKLAAAANTKMTEVKQ
jgi:hypothetical protein